jgi:hypothetical protein
LTADTQAPEVRVYLPAPNAPALSHVLAGSAIVSHHQPADSPDEPGGPARVLVYYEGNRYGAANMVTYADRAMLAYWRMRDHRRAGVAVLHGSHHVTARTSGTDKCQQHHGWLAGDEGVGRTRSHLEPWPRAQLELLAVNGETEPSGQDLNHGSAACLMLGELLVGVEAEHGHVHPVAPMYDLGDNGTGLDDHFAGGVGDQRMGHSGIIVRRTPTVKYRLAHRGKRRGSGLTPTARASSG